MRILGMGLAVVGLMTGAVAVGGLPAAAEMPAKVAVESDEPIFSAGVGSLGVYVLGEPGMLHVEINSQPAGTQLSVAWDIDDDGDYDDHVGADGSFTPIRSGNYVVRMKVRHSGMPPEDPSIISAAGILVARRVELSPVGIAGTAQVGRWLAVTGGATSPEAATRTFSWQRDGKTIEAWEPTYLVRSADAGRRIEVEVGATWHEYLYLDAKPRTTRSVAIRALNVARPSSIGIPRVGHRLAARNGTWIAPGHVRSHRWFRDGRPIRGATSTSYVLTRADRGRRISLRVAVARSGFPTVTAFSVERTIGR